MKLVVGGFCEDCFVGGSGVVVGGLGFGEFGGGVEAFFFSPALVYAVEAPLGGFWLARMGLVVDDDEDGVGVAGGEDAQGDPTAAVELQVFEGDVLELPSAVMVLVGDGLAVDDEFEFYVAGAGDAGAVRCARGSLEGLRPCGASSGR